MSQLRRKSFNRSVQDGCATGIALFALAIVCIVVPPLSAVLLAAAVLAPMMLPILLVGNKEGDCPHCESTVDVGWKTAGAVRCKSCRCMLRVARDQLVA